MNVLVLRTMGMLAIIIYALILCSGRGLREGAEEGMRSHHSESIGDHKPVVAVRARALGSHPSTNIPLSRCACVRTFIRSHCRYTSLSLFLKFVWPFHAITFTISLIFTTLSQESRDV